MRWWCWIRWTQARGPHFQAGLGNHNARGDAVVVDLPGWEGLVRKTFQAYNTALVAAVKGRAA